MATRRIGLVGTLTTSYNEPYNLARRPGSLDVISRGRAGWNVVTSGDGGTAGNHDRDEHYDHDTRHARGLEAVAVARGLWRSYEDGAFVRDRGTGVFLDRAKLHPLNHRGPFFSGAGPLNIERSPQGEPVIFQAGDSDQGRDRGAAIADGIFTHMPSFEHGQAFYRDIKGRVERLGRSPDEILVRPGVTTVVGDSDGEAREIEHALNHGDQGFEQALGEFGRAFGWHDFRHYGLDAPLPADVLRHAESSFYTNARKITDHAVEHGLTLRQAVERASMPRPSSFTGSAATVGREIVRWFDGRALDGLNIHMGHPTQFTRFVQEVVPILQESGVVRREYEHTTPRGHLELPAIANGPRGRGAERSELRVVAGLRKVGLCPNPPRAAALGTRSVRMDSQGSALSGSGAEPWP